MEPGQTVNVKVLMRSGSSGLSRSQFIFSLELIQGSIYSEYVWPSSTSERKLLLLLFWGVTCMKSFLHALWSPLRMNRYLPSLRVAWFSWLCNLLKLFSFLFDIMVHQALCHMTEQKAPTVINCMLMHLCLSFFLTNIYTLIVCTNLFKMISSWFPTQNH